MALEAGSTCGRFRVLHRLGAGAMGEVFLAEDPQIGRRVALKTVRLAAGDEGLGAELRSRLAREARAAGQLVHPHVVTLFEAGEQDGTFFLAFEYVEGADLAVRLQTPPPPGPAETLRIVRQTAEGLAAAHRRGIVHRDIKPANLLLTAEGTVKISDFGIARVAGAATALTEVGSLIGTPQYFSPEQIRGEDLDGRSDLFSLGVLFYELLAGRRPFTGETLTSLVYQVLGEEPPPVEELAPQTPPEVAELVRRLLAKGREARFASADDLARAIRRIEHTFEEEAAAATLFTPRAAAAALPTVTAADSTATAATELAVLESPAPERVSARPAGRLRGRAGIVGVAIATLVLMGGILTALWLGRTGEPETPAAPAPASEAAPELSNAGGDSATDSLVAGDDGAGAAAIADPQPEPAPPASSSTDPSPAVAARPVGTVVSFTVAPAPAAADAVVKVDGLVRGPAAGSQVVLRPGERRVEILAPGYRPLAFLVDARPDRPAGAPLAVTLEPDPAAPGDGRAPQRVDSPPGG